jgi:hypothetical protein
LQYEVQSFGTKRDRVRVATKEKGDAHDTVRAVDGSWSFLQDLLNNSDISFLASGEESS